MSDTSDSIDTTADVADTSSDGGESSSPVTESAPAETSVLDAELPAGMRTFDRSYVEKLRAEAGGNRTKLREVEQMLADRDARLEKFSPFDGYSDDDMEVWGSLASDWKSDPAVAAQTMQTIAVRVLGDPTATTAEKADAQAIIDNPAVTQAAESLTPDQVREIAREETVAQQTARERDEAVAGVFKTIGAAGYEEGSPEAFQVLWYANNRTEGDLEKAISMKKADDQGIIDRYVESMSKGGTPVRLPSSGDPGSPTTEQPKSIKDARVMADAWLAERQNL